MKKIISLFKRDYEGTRLVYDEVVPGAEWVIAGEGVATVKLDGTPCMIRGGMVYKRYDVKKGRNKPDNFEPAQDPDPVTGHWPGWIPVSDGPEDRWFREAHAFETKGGNTLANGTYELIGPKVQGNLYNLDQHMLEPHGQDTIKGTLITTELAFNSIKELLTERGIEGIVWHHEDGRMVKIKRKDFGLEWPIKREKEEKC